MKTKYLFLAALTSIALVSCMSDEFVGENTSPNVVKESTDGAIKFGSGFQAITRANHVGADAASLLNKRFYVGGFKTADGTTYNNVFKDYAVEWVANTAGTTESNTSDWEYVGVTPLSPKNTTVGFEQTIKYWDYSTTSYDFIAFATGNDNANAGTKDVADTYATGKIALSTIDHSGLETGAYTLEGDRAQLLNCYVADMVTVNKAKYGDEVQLAFRSLASKIRIALYETVPGYSVKDVKFYTQEVDPSKLGTDPRTDAATTPTAALIGKFSNKAKYTVTFPAADTHKAHVTIASGADDDYQTFGALTSNYSTAEKLEDAGPYYLGRASNAATYAGTNDPDHYYVKILPNEQNLGVYELAVDYTLVSTDGNGEEIKVYGATAYVPASYTKWLANYAYTYIFKISDNTNGWTSKVDTDPKGLFPITFDAIVVDSEENTQKTITTVASPSITTYQRGHDITKDEYSASNGKIYVQVMVDGVLKGDLNSKGALYTVTSDPSIGTPISEATVLDALNVIETGTTGRNGITLTAASSTATIDAIPGEDGNNITVTSGQAAEFEPSANIYAYVYTTDEYEGAYYATEPDGYPTGYYTDPKCTADAPASFVAGTYYKNSPSYVYTAVNTSSTPDGWTTDGIWYKDPDGTISAFGTSWAAGVYYKKYTVNHKVYGVKVIKVVA